MHVSRHLDLPVRGNHNIMGMHWERLLRAALLEGHHDRGILVIGENLYLGVWAQNQRSAGVKVHGKIAGRRFEAISAVKSEVAARDADCPGDNAVRSRHTAQQSAGSVAASLTCA